MKSAVLVYEDQYFTEFDRLVRALRRDAELPPLILEARSARGTGGFVNEVPKILRSPLKQTKAPPEMVLCVADADRPKNIAPSAAVAPTDAALLDEWIKNLCWSLQGAR